MTTELVIIDPKEYGLEEKQAEKMTSGLATILTERKALEEIYNSVIVKELNADTFKEARELRLKVQKNRTVGIEAWHKTNKAFYLAGGRFVDAYKNKEVIVNEQMEAKLLEIEKYEEKVKADQKAKLKAERLELLLPYDVDVTFVSIEEMTEEQFTGFLSTNKLAFETKKENERLAEIARIEAEKKAEQERIEREKAEAERLEAQRLENERLKAEAEKREKELAIERKKLADEQTKKEAAQKAELERLAKIQEEKDKSAKIESDRLAKIAADEKAKSDKLEAELKAKKDAEDLALANEKARIEAEQKEKEAKEKAALLAPDKDKVKAFYTSFTALKFPELESEEGKKMAKRIEESLELVRKLIITDSKNLI